MNYEERLSTFKALGHRIRKMSEKDVLVLAEKAFAENKWFTQKSVSQAFEALGTMLEDQELEEWSAGYKIGKGGKSVGIVMAGNIPLVGFHDLLCVLLSDHRAVIKTSSKDQVLVREILAMIADIQPAFTDRYYLPDRLKDVDAIIATGSDNSAHYFEYYFSKYPHIIRKNRTSIAILDGSEGPDDLLALGHDVYDYYGLGCRNVSKVFLPAGYDLPQLLDAWQPFAFLSDNHKYQHNYDYRKSIMLVNGDKHLDSGFSLLKASEDLVSPIALTYYEFYDSAEALKDKVLSMEDKLQCIVSGGEILEGTAFGQTQVPTLADYADNVDTMAFLQQL